MQCESVTDGTLAMMTAMVTDRSSRTVASGSRFKAHAPRTDGSSRITIHTASDDRFEVIFLGERYDVPAGIDHARHLLDALRQQHYPDRSAAAGTTVPESPDPDSPGQDSPDTGCRTSSTPPVLPDEFLNRIDGIFIAVIHDRHRQRAHFISDRLGLRYLYFHRQNGRLWWATETKAFLRCPDFSAELSRDALDDFFRFDFLRGNKTLLRDAEMMPAGTVRTCDFREDRITDHRYWRWEEKGEHLTSEHSVTEHAPARHPAALHDAAGHLATLFRDAVLRRLPEDASVLSDGTSPASVSGRLTPVSGLPPGLGLSGGLDSRAILATLPDPSAAWLFTFGRRNSLDVNLAQRVSRIAGTGCEFIEIHAGNWLAPRLEAVWWTDGHANILHMHGIEALGTLTANAGIQLNGGVQNFIRGAMTADAGTYQFDRLRRFQRLGTIIDDRFLPTRLPFYDYKLLDFLRTLPDDLLRDDRLYRVMLLDHFPRLFRGIPYANTGYALDARFRTLRSLAFRARRRLGLVNYALHDYPRWIRRQIPAFQRFLDTKKTRINDLGFRVDAHRLLNRANSRLLSLPDCEALCRFLTLEVYLRMVEKPEKREFLTTNSANR